MNFKYLLNKFNEPFVFFLIQLIRYINDLCKQTIEIPEDSIKA